MIYTAVLATHISLALLTGAIILYTLLVVATAQARHYAFLAVLLAVVAALEVSTGVSLIFVSPTATPLSVALHMTAYLSVCAGVEALLYVASRRRTA